jgi:recombination protein RecT
MSQALATQDNAPVPLKTQIARMQNEFAKALPGHITADRFVRTAQTAIALTRNIEKVRNPQSLLASCTKAAADGLILDGREAALVVDYNGDVQYRPMMRGLLKLAYNSGMMKSISVQIVCENDEFEYVLGDDERITHKLDFKRPRGEPYAVYAVAHMNDGAVMREVMTVEQINKIRDRSDAYRAFKAGKIKSTPWSTDWEEMARKTVFRRLSKYLPSSSERDTFHQAVERIDDDYSHEIEAEAAPADPLPATKKRGAAAAALKDITPQSRAQEPAEDEPDHDRETGEIVDYDGPDQQPGDDI